jgi:hypothetical protein
VIAIAVNDAASPGLERRAGERGIPDDVFEFRCGSLPLPALAAGERPGFFLQIKIYYILCSCGW